jgi:outer membrane immunogenic protein
MRPLSKGSLALLPILFASFHSTADAADFGARRAPWVRPLTYDWSGLHVGITGGGIFDGNDPSFGFVNIDPADLVGLPSSAPLSSQGALIGGEVGYDIQLGGWVVGVEGDLSWTNFGDSATTIVPADSGGGGGRPQLTFATNYHMDWISTVRGRIGIPFDHFLIYGTGGLAFADVSMNQTVTVGTDGQLVGSTDKTKTGWTLGGGAEYALCDNITLKAEALWIDLGNVSLRATNPQFDGALDVEQKVEGVIARGGIGYKF